MRKILFFSFLFVSFQSFSQIVDPFSIRYQNQQKGGITMLSNVSVSCTNCAATTSQIPPNGNGINNSFSMSYVDIDGNPSTFMSSSDSLNLANCSEVLWAGLYWSARIATSGNASSTPNYSIRNQIKLKVNNGAYQILTADELQDNATGHQTYHCFKNITSIVQNNGIKARYTVADLVTRLGSGGMYGGWTIVVVYKNVYQSMRNLTVFDGLANVSAGNTVIIPITGFVTPLVGPVSFELGVVSHDGDRGDQGDQLLFNGAGSYVNISDATHNANDVFNSTISIGGVLTPFRNPSFNNTLGHDVSIFIPNNTAFNYIGNNTNSANIQITTGGETILTSVVTSVIDVFEPDLRATVYIDDLNGGQVNPGDILEYTVVGKNIGSDVSLNTFITDTLDPRTVFVPNSISITYGQNSGPKTDAFLDDQAEYDPVNRVVKARIGTGANATNGGTVLNSPTGADSTVLKFQVTVIDDCVMFQCDPSLEHKAYIFGTGNISGNVYNNDGLSDLYDALGCPTIATDILTINVAPCPLPTISSNSPICQNETIQFNFPFSTQATYAWTGPNGFSSSIHNPSISNATVNMSGKYVVTVTFPGLDCEIIDSITFTVNPPPTISLNSITNVNCFGAATGNISITSSLNGPFTTVWTNSNGAVVQPVGLVAGTYQVIVTNSNSCSSTASYAVTQNPQINGSIIPTTSYNGFNVSCFGASNAGAIVNATGGNPSYSYVWNNGAIGNSAFNLNAGLVSVTITDGFGCTRVISTTLSQPPLLNVSLTSTNNLCFGDSEGSISATVSGGTTPYQYSWSNGETSANLMNLTSGTYSVVITDQNGCIANASTTLEQPSLALNLSSVENNVLCFGFSSGAIDITPIGGITPYTYTWSTGATSQDLIGIVAGIYSVTITDDNNCTLTSSFQITEPASPISISFTPTPVDCFNELTGSIDITASGGTGNLTYLWNTGETTQDLISIPTGNYSVSVTDENNCILSTPIINVTQPIAPLQSSFTKTDIACFGGATGAIDLATSGGTTPYSYLWSTGETSSDITNLVSGNYSVIVTDANGCTTSNSINLTQPIEEINLIENHINILCFGESTGSIDVTTTGGTTPYLYSWDSGQNTEDITTISSGIYTLTVTDAQSCIETIQVEIEQPIQPLTATETHTDALCIGGQQGTINLTVFGGTAPYTINWNNGSTAEDQINLLAGIYEAQITDINACSTSISVEILDPSNTTVLTETHIDAACFSQAIGSIDLIVTGGTSPYNFEWSTGATTEDISNLFAGNYFVNVTDFNGCGEFLAVEITEPETAVTGSLTHTDVLCHGNNTGQITASASGGVAPYLYLWSNGETTAQITQLIAGTYSVVISDANGCEFNLSEEVIQPENPISITEQITNVDCFGNSTAAIDLTVTGGTPIYSFSWSNGSADPDLVSIFSGDYTITVTDNNNCISQKTISVSQPLAPLSDVSVSTAVGCFGESTGAIDVSISGGTLPYGYSWSTGGTTNQILNSPAGNYSLTVTDANGCTLDGNYSISQPAAPLSVVLSMTPVICFGEANGSTAAVVSGGTTPYLFDWNSGSTSNAAFDLIAGNYSLTITDQNGCQLTDLIEVTQPDALAILSSTIDVLCFGQSTGSISVTAIGGLGEYAYNWDNGATTSTIQNLPAGIYEIAITDENNCMFSSSIEIEQPDAPISFDFTLVDNVCFEGITGSATVQIAGGTSPYNSTWNTGSVALSISNLLSGDYVFETTDANNCFYSETVSISEPDQISVQDSIVSNVSCNDFSDGSINLTTIGGTSPYQYSWNSGQISEDVANLIAGNYAVTITDANGCTRDFNFQITQPDTIDASYTFIEPSCFGYTDGSISTTLSGGTSPYNYAWSNGITTQDNVAITSGNYDLTITDNNGCVFVLNTVLTQPLQIQVTFDANYLEGCDPLDVKLTNTSEEQFLSTWNFGDGETAIGSQVDHVFTGAGCYDITLEVTDANGCFNSATYSDFICVLVTPVAEIGVTNTELGVAYPETTITNLSINANSYSWNMGDNSILSNFFEPGNYTFPTYNNDFYLVSLIAYNNNGCVDSAEVLIKYNNSLIMYVPNTFTPNGDESNQVFKPVLPSNVSDFNMKIYNRWGQLIFESFDFELGWDGTFNGVPVQDGTYTWDIFVRTHDPFIYKKQGIVNVIR